MKAAIYGIRLAKDIADAWQSIGDGEVQILRPGEEVPSGTDYVFWAARSRNRPWHNTVQALMEICKSGVQNILVVGSDAAEGVNTTQGPEYHAEKAAELATVRRIAADGPIINMVSPRQLSHSGGQMQSRWVAGVCVDFALFAAVNKVSGQHIQL